VTPDGYTSTGIGLVTSSSIPYRHGIVASEAGDATYILKWMSKYPDSFGASTVMAHYVINSATQMNVAMQPLEANQEFIVSGLPLHIGDQFAYSFTYQDAVTSVSTDSDWTSITLRSPSDVPTNQSTGNILISQFSALQHMLIARVLKLI
jgi:hypothetical protein